jgi:nicotinate-nucleotide adenylyltransferase
MKLVMLGGTFNPPHLGHLKIGSAVKEAFGYERLVLVPSYRPAHKDVDTDISFQQRFEMVELAAGAIEGCFVSDCEYRRKGISYSFDTILYLKENYTNGEKPGLIIGDDLVSGFRNWHRAEELSREADIIICHRGEPADLDFPYPHRYFKNPLFPASSTEIRERLAAGDGADALLPPLVMKYIREKGLYGV